MDHYSMSPEERVRQVEIKIREWLDKDNKAQLLVGQEWLEGNKRGLMQDKNAKMLEAKHWLEATDPLHRYGSNLWLYLKAWKKSESSKTFFEWLDHGDGRGQDVEKCGWRMLDVQRVSYLQKPEEREGFEVIAKNGKIYYKTSGDPVETKMEEQWIYVLSLCRELFVGKKERGSFHHSTFLAGAPVMAAGSIQVSNGTIKELSRRSGHYKPTKENFHRLIRFLEEEQVDLTNIISSQGIKGVNFV